MKAKKTKLSPTKETQELIDMMCNWIYSTDASYSELLDSLAIAAGSTIGAAAVTLGLDPSNAMHDLANIIDNFANSTIIQKWHTADNMPN